MDEGKYIILTKQRKADVFKTVWLGDVAVAGSSREVQIRVDKAANLLGENVTETGQWGSFPEDRGQF